MVATLDKICLFSYNLNNVNKGHPLRINKNHVTRLLANKKDFSGNSRNQQQEPNFLALKVPNPVPFRSALVIFGLGFIDAGYSGDWSRIGAISKESEDLIKVAAFLVIPICVVLVLSISDKDE